MPGPSQHRHLLALACIALLLAMSADATVYPIRARHHNHTHSTFSPSSEPSRSPSVSQPRSQSQSLTLSDSTRRSASRSVNTSQSATKSRTARPTRSPSNELTSSRTRSPQATRSRTQPLTATLLRFSPSNTTTASKSSEETSSRSAPSPSASETLSSTAGSASRTLTFARSPSASLQRSPSLSLSRSPSASVERSGSRSRSLMASATHSLVPTPSHSSEATLTFTITPPPTPTRSAEVTSTVTRTITPPPTRTKTYGTFTVSESSSVSIDVTGSGSLSHTETQSVSASTTATAMTVSASQTLASITVVQPLATNFAVDSTITPALFRPLPTLYEAAVRNGDPLADRTIKFGLTGDFFVVGLSPADQLSCLTFDLSRAPVLATQLGDVWQTSSFVEVNSTSITVRLLKAPSLELKHSEVFVLSFLPRCFATGQPPTVSAFSFIIVAVSDMVPPTTPPPSSAPLAPPAIRTAAEAMQLSTTTVAMGAGALLVASAVATASLTAMARVSSLESLASCAGVGGGLTLAENPTGAWVDAGVRDEGASTFLGALLANTGIAVGVLLLHALTIFIGYAVEGARSSPAAADAAESPADDVGERSPSTPTRWQRAMALVGFPSRSAVLAIVLGSVSIKCAIVCFARVHDAGPLAATIVCALWWILFGVAHALSMGASGFKAIYVARRDWRSEPAVRCCGSVAMRQFVLKHGRWVDRGRELAYIAPLTLRAATHSAGIAKLPDVFVGRYGAFFVIHRGGVPWYLALDLFFTVVLSIIDASAVLSHSCSAALIAAVVVTVVKLLSVMALRPYNVTSVNVFAMVLDALQCVMAVSSVAGTTQASSALGFVVGLLSVAATLASVVSVFVRSCRRSQKSAAVDRRHGGYDLMPHRPWIGSAAFPHQGFDRAVNVSTLRAAATQRNPTSPRRASSPSPPPKVLLPSDGYFGSGGDDLGDEELRATLLLGPSSSSPPHRGPLPRSVSPFAWRGFDDSDGRGFYGGPSSAFTTIAPLQHAELQPRRNPPPPQLRDTPQGPLLFVLDRRGLSEGTGFAVPVATRTPDDVQRRVEHERWLRDSMEL